jgi:hypothetical protein
VSVHLAHCLCCLKNEVVYESGMLRMKEFPAPEGSIAGLSFVYLSLTENILIYH